jgi:hypothetical protein
MGETKARVLGSMTGSHGEHVVMLAEKAVEGRRLGRHVKHDPRSWLYPYKPREAAPLRSVRHERHIPVLDQGNLGSCTGNACEGAIGTSGLFEALPDNLKPSTTSEVLDERGAIALYSRATEVDGYSGSYPPDDTGSDGLSVAKAAKERGLISGYTHAFSVEDAVQALMEQPIITGVDWYEGFDSPRPDGLLVLSGSVRGGHELVLDELVIENPSDLLDPGNRVGGTNSWGPGWGSGGHFYWDLPTWKKLLDSDGDATILVPINAPAPTPIPSPEPRPFPLSFLLTWLRWLWRVLGGGR